MSTITNISPVVQRGQLTPRLDTLSRPAGALALDAKARQFKAMLASALGGHAAEQVVFGEISTGAENDIDKATNIARKMVKVYGMSARLGTVALDRKEERGGVGGAMGEHKPYSEKCCWLLVAMRSS